MQIKKPGNYSFVLPWIAFIPWWGMLVTMLICWAAQGHPIYWFMDSSEFPVYISDIGATNLRPLFISCAGWQGLFYFITIMADFYQRGGKLIPGKKPVYHMPPWFSVHEGRLIVAAALLGGIGELGLLFCSIFSTALYHHVHLSMVGVFVAFMFLSVCCHSAAYFIMGKYYALIHPLANNPNNVKYNDLKRTQWLGYTRNKFVVSASLKIIWLTLALIWAICFGGISDNSKSACFEWLLAFWFGILFMIISADFYMGSRFKESKYFTTIPIEKFNGFYKYDDMFNRTSLAIADMQVPESDKYDTTRSIETSNT